MQSELADKFDEWLKSTEGKQCSSLYGLGDPVNLRYLMPRIRQVFLAGAQANEEAREEICIKLMSEDPEAGDPNAG